MTIAFRDNDDDAAQGTVLPRRDLPAVAAEPRRVQLGLGRDEVFSVVGAAVGALGLGVLLSGAIGAIPVGWMPVTSFIWFVALYAALVFLTERGPAVRDRFWTVVLWAAGVVVVGTLALVVVFVIARGWPVYAEIFTRAGGFWARFHFFTQDMSLAGPLSGLDVGGILYALLGTLIQIGIALIVTVPLGLTTAIYLGEVGGRLARVVRTVVEAMTALPSVVAGLFIWSTVILFWTHQNNGFAAALAITILMLPIMIRSADIVLRLVPGNLREAGLALGAGQWATVWYVVLPTVRSGLVTAGILATAHGIGETAPVLLTSGVTTYTNVNPFHGPMTSLPLAALEFIESSQNVMKTRGFATAAFLLVLVIVLFALARRLGGQDAGVVTPRRAQTLKARSGRTLRRILGPRNRPIEDVYDPGSYTASLSGSADTALSSTPAPRPGARP